MYPSGDKANGKERNQMKQALRQSKKHHIWLWNVNTVEYDTASMCQIYMLLILTQPLISSSVSSTPFGIREKNINIECITLIIDC